MNPVFLANQARALLQTLEPGQTLTSAQLLARLGVDVSARTPETNGLFTMLRRHSETFLADCFTRGVPYTNQYGKAIRPYFWHAPVQTEESEVDLDQLLNGMNRKLDKILAHLDSSESYQGPL